MSIYETLFVEPWPFWAAGAAIGLFAVLFAAVSGKPLAVSGGVEGACSLVTQVGPLKKAAQDRWKLLFVLGIPLGGLAAQALATGPQLTEAMGSFDAQISSSFALKAGLLTLGGLLLGFGARWAGGCTSGHAIMGVAQGARASLISTTGFMIGGFAAANVLFALGGVL